MLLDKILWDVNVVVYFQHHLGLIRIGEKEAKTGLCMAFFGYAADVFSIG